MTSLVREQDEMTVLADAAELLARAVVDESATEGELARIADEARTVANRLREKRFDIAVVGEFNRGKSTLLNKLLHRGILPAGVLPVTSIVTEVTYGDREQVQLQFEDGSDQVIDLRDLDKYVTEEANPGNRHHVATARVVMPSNVLRNGAVLVDTPGVGSIFRHNSTVAREMILKADGAIMVMSADTPITDAERSLIKLLGQRAEQTFYVLNRTDHIEAHELQRVRWFVERVLEQATGKEQKLYCVSAKTGDGMDAFARAFENFLNTGLQDARLTLARRDISTLADKMENACSLEESALSMSASELEHSASEYRRAADWQHEAFSDDVILFRHATERTIRELEERLKSVTVDENVREKIKKAVEKVPHSELDAAIDKSIQETVKEMLEPIRRREEGEVERSWRRASERFEKATQRRTDKLAEVAGSLFSVDLKPTRVSQPSQQRGRFFYSAPDRTDQPTGVLTRLFRPLTQERRNRERLLSNGMERLNQELQIHLERLHSDLADRIADSNKEFEHSMEDQVNQVNQAMMHAVQRAYEAKSEADSGVTDLRNRAGSLRIAAQTARNAANR